MIRLLSTILCLTLSHFQALEAQTAVSFDKYSASDAVEYYPGTNSTWLKGAGTQVSSSMIVSFQSP